MSVIDCDGTEDIVCPYCGRRHEPTDLISGPPVSDGERFQMGCDGCGRDFNVECSITTLYSTEKETEE